MDLCGACFVKIGYLQDPTHPLLPLGSTIDERYWIDPPPQPLANHSTSSVFSCDTVPSSTPCNSTNYAPPPIAFAKSANPIRPPPPIAFAKNASPSARLGVCVPNWIDKAIPEGQKGPTCMTRIDLSSFGLPIKDPILRHISQAWNTEARIVAYTSAEVLARTLPTMHYGTNEVDLAAGEALWTMAISDSELQDSFYDYLKQYLPPTFENRPLVGVAQGPIVTRYDLGQGMAKHTDTPRVTADGLRSELTLLIFFSKGEDDIKGGVVRFLSPDPTQHIDFAPTPGDALCFNHGIPYEMLPMEKGHNYVLKADVVYGHLPSQPLMDGDNPTTQPRSAHTTTQPPFPTEVDP
ncbi:hypothetical protein DFJ77DRAFT_510589 [Powellomyces hirtus]|nr:hypothetical protein DFJ77DRAFT_510589 [Powellomyces hirtus]